MIEAIILGLLQGLTEFLPVSSSAHLAILPRITNMAEQSNSFDIVVHSGTLLALLLTQYKELLSIIRGMFSDQNKRNLIVKIVIATIPALLIGAIIEISKIETDSNAVIALSLSLGGLIMIYADKITKKKNEKINEVTELPKINFKQAGIIGLIQPLAYIRGVSRSGSTIVAGIFSGMSLHDAIRFSFLISIPVLAAASTINVYDLAAHGTNEDPLHLIIGFISAFLSGILAIQFMLTVTSRIGLKWFGYYRILLSFIIVITLIL